VRGWAKGTLPTYQDRKEFFEGIVGGDPDPVALLRGDDTPGGTPHGGGQAGEQAVRELIARAQSAHALQVSRA
jgi:precorrin-2 dehydrogenase/sirohydrochlorin ferrochelatase